MLSLSTTRGHWLLSCRAPCSDFEQREHSGEKSNANTTLKKAKQARNEKSG